jgi:outer membrane biosynthesis protein TonB
MAAKKKSASKPTSASSKKSAQAASKASKSKTQIKPKPKPKPKLKAKLKAKLKPKPKPKAKLKPKSRPNPKPRPKLKPGTQPGPKPEEMAAAVTTLGGSAEEKGKAAQATRDGGTSGQSAAKRSGPKHASVEENPGQADGWQSEAMRKLHDIVMDAAEGVEKGIKGALPVVAGIPGTVIGLVKQAVKPNEEKGDSGRKKD